MRRYEKMTKAQLLFLIQNTPNKRLKLYLIKLLTLKVTNVIK
jgi:hypothetical protein